MLDFYAAMMAIYVYMFHVFIFQSIWIMTSFCLSQ